MIPQAADVNNYGIAAFQLRRARVVVRVRTVRPEANQRRKRNACIVTLAGGVNEIRDFQFRHAFAQNGNGFLKNRVNEFRGGFSSAMSSSSDFI